MPVRAGDDLISIGVATPAEGHALAEHLRDGGDWIEVVPGIDSVIVRFDAAELDRALAWFATRQRRFGMTGEQVGDTAPVARVA